MWYMHFILCVANDYVCDYVCMTRPCQGTRPFGERGWAWPSCKDVLITHANSAQLTITMNLTPFAHADDDLEFWNELISDLQMTNPGADPESFAIYETAFENASNEPFEAFEKPSAPPAPVVIEKTLQSAMDDIVAAFPDVPLTRFKREAGIAWRRKNLPSGPGAQEPPMGEFQTFVKENIKTVQQANPDVSHAEHMRTIGSMWRDVKNKRART